MGTPELRDCKGQHIWPVKISLLWSSSRLVNAFVALTLQVSMHATPASDATLDAVQLLLHSISVLFCFVFCILYLC